MLLPWDKRFAFVNRIEKSEEDDDIPKSILVIKDQVKNEREITRRINYELLNQAIDRDVDVMAASTETWNRNIDNIAFVYRRINSEGIVLYE